MFERPTKSDLDTAISMLIHESRHKLMAEVNRSKSKMEKVGITTSQYLSAAITAADTIHKAAIEQAQTILFDYIERMERPASEVAAWSRPHIDNLNSSVLGVVPAMGFPQDHQRLTQQYRAVFQQRSDIMLRNVMIGHQKGAGFARAAKLESKEEWISAAEAVRLLAPDGKTQYSARMALCKRAHAGMVRARAQRFIVSGRAADNVEIQRQFWWAEGHEALTQDWTNGDFDTWIDALKLTGDVRLGSGKVHLEAFNVSFLRANVEDMIPASPPHSPAARVPAATGSTQPAVGGRPPADWWEDCLIDLCFKHFRGELLPKSQADIVRAMQDWITERGCEAAESTIKLRARKLMDAIKRDTAAEN
jgi:hypothetical protein